MVKVSGFVAKVGILVGAFVAGVRFGAKILD